MRSQKSRTIATLRRTTLIFAVMAVTACTTLTRKHGFVPLPEDLGQMQVGAITHDEVIAMVGPPTTAGAVDDNTLYYVQSERERFGPFEPRTVNRQVLAIRFDSANVLSNIERFGLEDGRVVVLSRRITDDGIANVTVISQLLGAIGRIDASTLLNGPLGGDDDL